MYEDKFTEVNEVVLAVGSELSSMLKELCGEAIGVTILVTPQRSSGKAIFSTNLSQLHLSMLFEELADNLSEDEESPGFWRH
jgi:hypothetical protein